MAGKKTSKKRDQTTPPSSGGGTAQPQRLLFGLTIVCSAFLLFFVQPMVGKRLLPWYGGAPGVWTLCLAFYQVTLFAGYAYAHGLRRLGRPPVELAIHAGLFALACLSLPVLPDETFRPEPSRDPTVGILRALLANVALPFLFLSATGPLLQAWFSRALPKRTPYFLYALSNLGSLVALFAYPFLFEPNLGLDVTGTSWSIGFATLGVGVLACGGFALRSQRETSGTERASESAVALSGSRMSEIGLWLALSGVAVVLLMGITNQLCLDVASVPFLWLLPLAIYLITYILCFSSERFYRRAPFVVLVALSMLLLPLAEPAFNDRSSFTGLQSRPIAIGLHLILLFSACMVLHGELYRRRPAANALTAYYLWVSAGGALGGLFVGIAAPLWFNDYYEVPAGFAAWWVLVLGLAMRDNESALRSGAPVWRRIAATLAACAIPLTLLTTERFRTSGVVHQERSFFGVLRVLSSEPGKAPARVLRHGTTLHGLQFTEVNLRRLPTAYYGFAGGVGLTLQGAARQGPIRVGVIGLGIGTLAAYGRNGDLYRFYEIDPAVIDLAQDPSYFHYLADSKAAVEVVEADGRLALEAEQRRGERPWDVLIVDAFSSDSVPVHLLTREAFALYTQRLAPGGVLAIHVSNRHLALTDLAFRLARSSGLVAAELRTASAPRLTTVPARWVLLARERAHLERQLNSVASATRSLRLPRNHVSLGVPQTIPSKRIPLWTDDYSDLLSILRSPEG